MDTAKIKEKKEFIHYFLNNFQMKRRECVWILNYINNHSDIMEKTHFVENADCTEKGMVLSTQEVDDVPFRFYKDNVMSTDAERAFHDIRLQRGEHVYITLNFKNKMQNEKYIKILEENPFKKEDEVTNPEDIKRAEEVIQESLASFQKERLMEKINQALDTRNKEEFMKLTDSSYKFM